MPICFIPLKVIRKDSTDTFEVFKFSVFTEREPAGRFSKMLSLYVKISDTHSENRNENLEGSH